MPKRVDHGVRKRQITDAVARITVKGGLPSATFREVAAEAGVSVRLVQYYFGTKDQLMLTALQHVTERATRRFAGILGAADAPPRDVIRSVLASFIPTDDESRENMLLFVAFHTASLTDPTLARPEARGVPRALQELLAAQLRRLELRDGVDPDLEATILAAMIASLAQAVLDGTTTIVEAMAVIDYAIERSAA